MRACQVAARTYSCTFTDTVAHTPQSSPIHGCTGLGCIHGCEVKPCILMVYKACPGVATCCPLFDHSGEQWVCSGHVMMDSLSDRMEMWGVNHLRQTAELFLADCTSPGLLIPCSTDNSAPNQLSCLWLQELHLQFLLSCVSCACVWRSVFGQCSK